VRRPRTLAPSETYAKVNTFLTSKSRNSIQTKIVYSIALSHFQTFLQSAYKNYNLETVLTAIKEKKLNVYSLLDNFVGHLTQRKDASNGNTKLSSKSIWLYIAGVRSYLEYWDIDISSNKFRGKVTLPKKYKRNKEALDAKDIRTILLSCTNPRLKAFLMVLASSGMRSKEAISLRNCDIDFSVRPTKVHIRPEFSKTKQEHNVYVSDECSKELQKLIDSKYANDQSKNYPNHLVFAKQNYKDSIETVNIYRRLHEHFIKVLQKVEMDKRKDGQGIQRRQISFHSFRTFVKTTFANQTNSDFSEWMLGHSGSVYWSMKESEKRALYSKTMPYVTFLDYSVLETTGKNIQAKLEEKDREIELIRSEHEIYKKELQTIHAKADKIDKALAELESNPNLSPIRKTMLKLIKSGQLK
jgi:integrase